ncbi:MAG: hypothetical protein JXB49_09675 [Bacteroidales bacterium]|nr:hypothetical protein [Bacteroidales bacterium]
MMKHELFIKLPLLIIIFICIACSGKRDQNNSGNTENDSLYYDTEVMVEELTETFYLIPSPNEILSFVNEGEVVYKADLVIDPLNTKDLIDLRTKYLNIGLLSSDLAYLTLLSQNRDMFKFFNALIDLSKESNLPIMLDDFLLESIRKNLNNPDSLTAISNEMYLDIIDKLNETNNFKASAIIASGAFVECLYIAFSFAHNVEESNSYIQRIIEQKFLIDDLILNLQEYKNDPNVEQTLNDIESIVKSFENIGLTSIKVQESNTRNEDAIVLGGENVMEISQEEFIELKKEVNKLRNKWYVQN